MKNFVGRDIPDCLLVGGREVYQGKNAKDGVYFTKAGPRVRRCEKPVETKVVPTLKEALLRCGAHDGMTVSFHHHLRDGDYVVNLTVATLFEELGLKDITIAATSLGSAHDPVAEYIRQGKVVGIQTSGIRVGSPAVTSRGFTEADMDQVAEYIALAATDFEASKDKILAGVAELTAAHPIYG